MDDFLCLFVRDTEIVAKITKNIENKYFAYVKFYLLCNIFPRIFSKYLLVKLHKPLIIGMFKRNLYLLQRDSLTSAMKACFQITECSFFYLKRRRVTTSKTDLWIS